LLYDRRDGLEARYVRRVLGFRDVPLVAHWIPSSSAFVDAALIGLGWGVNSELLVREHIRCGKLADLVAGKFITVPLFWQHWRIKSATLDVLTRALTQQAKRML
jgi:LysR family transcriptional regulator (chromosome initiation inhibitor)